MGPGPRSKARRGSRASQAQIAEGNRYGALFDGKGKGSIVMKQTAAATRSSRGIVARNSADSAARLIITARYKPREPEFGVVATARQQQAILTGNKARKSPTREIVLGDRFLTTTGARALSGHKFQVWVGEGDQGPRGRVACLAASKPSWRSSSSLTSCRRFREGDLAKPGPGRARKAETPATGCYGRRQAVSPDFLEAVDHWALRGIHWRRINGEPPMGSIRQSKDGTWGASHGINRTLGGGSLGTRGPRELSPAGNGGGKLRPIHSANILVGPAPDWGTAAGRGYSAHCRWEIPRSWEV